MSSPRILIVDDDALLADSLEYALARSGFAIAGVAYRLDQALGLISDLGIDAAIVDANLHGLSAAPAVEALIARGLPFIVYSGDPRIRDRPPFRNGLIIEKPAGLTSLIHGLDAILKR